MKILRTADLGFNAAKREIARRGARGVEVHKDGNKRYVMFTGLDGNRYSVTTRSKSIGDWQTSINYGESKNENVNERKFWLFVDLEFDPPKFYPVPLWRIQNDIYEAFRALLEKHGGHRARNDNSTHHAVRIKRIAHWESRLAKSRWKYS